MLSGAEKEQSLAPEVPGIKIVVISFPVSKSTQAMPSSCTNA
jgi:hypothetical protein